MDNDRNTVIHIGQSRSGGGGAPRPKTLRTKGELNAAKRVGAVQTERRAGSANSKPNLEGQRDKKIDGETGITPLEAPGKKVSEAVKTAREKLKWSQTELAKKCNTNVKVISKLEQGEKQDKLTTIPWDALRRHLGVVLAGSNPSQLTAAAKRKEKEKAEAEAAEKEGKAKE